MYRKNKKMNNLFATILIAFFSTTVTAQINVHTEDVEHFWQTFDSVQKTQDSVTQIAIIQHLYIDKASEGLKGFMKKLGYQTITFHKHILNNKEKLNQVKIYTLNIAQQKKEIEEKVAYFKMLYPNFKSGEIFFLIGVNQVGGTTSDNHVVIGCDVVANNQPDWAVNIVLHEFVHTQQKLYAAHLLVKCIQEGMADFIASILNKKTHQDVFPSGYVAFGLKNEKEVWNSFKKYIGATDEDGKFFNWLYGSTGYSINGTLVKDLGYFMGHQICKSYYDRTTDKTAAIKEILEFNLSTDAKAKEFLLLSGYVPLKDVDYVKKLVFKPVVEKKKNIKKVVYGYRINKESIIFEYDLPVRTSIKEVKYITIAGTFNNWNPNNQAYQLNFIKGKRFELLIPKSKFEMNKQYAFKFVMNGDNWLPVPENAKNVEVNGDGNLTFILK
jgi:hypothetical protein